jgi:hypothetical protein
MVSKKSVILSEASGGLAFRLAAGGAESKDLGGKAWSRGIKFTLSTTEGGEAAMGDGVLSAFDHPWKKVAGSFDSGSLESVG